MTSERRTPLYEAYHSNRYERQALISQYQEQYECNLIILSDFFLQADSVPFLEETLSDADSSRELHIILHTMEAMATRLFVSCVKHSRGVPNSR